MVKADAEPRTPIRPTATAMRRWVGVTMLGMSVSTGFVWLVGASVFAIVVSGEGSRSQESWKGRAMRSTPSKDTTPAICSIRVKGSLSKMEQAQHTTSGARNEMTVASDKGRKIKESNISA